MRRGPPVSATARATVMVMATAERRATAPPRVRATASAPAMPVTDMPVPARGMPGPVLAADTPVAADTGPGTRRAAARLPRSGNARLGAERFTSLSHLSRALSGAGLFFPAEPSQRRGIALAQKPLVVVQADEIGAETAPFAPAAFQDADARQPRGAHDEPPGELDRARTRRVAVAIPAAAIRPHRHALPFSSCAITPAMMTLALGAGRACFPLPVLVRNGEREKGTAPPPRGRAERSEEKGKRGARAPNDRHPIF